MGRDFFDEKLIDELVKEFPGVKRAALKTSFGIIIHEILQALERQETVDLGELGKLIPLIQYYNMSGLDGGAHRNIVRIRLKTTKKMKEKLNEGYN